MYSLYRNNYGLSDPAIASLFATGFLCSGISAMFVGSLADRFGRKKACLAYCAIYSASCIITTMFRQYRILLMGRALGGLGTTLLFTVFETWMIAEYNRLDFAKSACSLSSIYGMMTAANGLVAISSGLIAQLLVGWSGTEKAPFFASMAFLTFAFCMIAEFWVSLVRSMPVRRYLTGLPGRELQHSGVWWSEAGIHGEEPQVRQGIL